MKLLIENTDIGLREIVENTDIRLHDLASRKYLYKTT